MISGSGRVELGISFAFAIFEVSLAPKQLESFLLPNSLGSKQKKRAESSKLQTRFRSYLLDKLITLLLSLADYPESGETARAAAP